MTEPTPASRSHVGRVTTKVSPTSGKMSAVRSTSQLLRRQLWAWPIIAAAVLGFAGWWVSRSVEDAMRTQRIEMLTTVLNADVAALKAWMKDHSGNAELIVGDESLRPIVQELVAIAETKKEVERSLVQSKAQSDLRARLARRISGEGYSGFMLVNPEGVVLAAEQDMPVGKQMPDEQREFCAKVLTGKPAVSKPYRSQLLHPDENGHLRVGLPKMLAGAAVRDAEGKPIATLALRFRPEAEFTKILQVAQAGDTGEAYAFDRNGLMLSQSRFDEELKQCGLLLDEPDARSILTVHVRDPGVNMMAGERPTLRRSEQPLTRLAADAVQGRSGCDPDGYRDYRGEISVGAWSWLGEHDFGVATEMDLSEAYRPVFILRRAFWSLMTLLAISALAIFIAMLYIARQQKALQRATLAAMQLGQYTLEEKLGAGGMGTVYRARHKMLRRPTAVKLLDVDKMSEAAIVRFEREVQLTSSLTHPNTVAVFDYGRTPEGIFFYAMEYLDGMNFDDFVRRFGPISAARTAHLLRQACGSLAEAHAIGLVHRDIKPANLFLTNRGGIWDFVKLLDFGLVKSLHAGDGNLTSVNAMMGTPLYMAPEAVDAPEKVDARSDVYALGAVAYFLVTGDSVFTGASVLEICLKHVRDAAPRPSERGLRIDSSFEDLIMRCLAKNPADRPANAMELLKELDAWTCDDRWTSADAAEWWMKTDRPTMALFIRSGMHLASPTPINTTTLAADARPVSPNP